MPYFNNNDVNILFIHIPKTGGTSVEFYLSEKYKIKLDKSSYYTTTPADFYNSISHSLKILKIYNIAVNFKKQCVILDRIDIIVKMEDLDKKILRNIVNVNSLYLNL